MEGWEEGGRIKGGETGDMEDEGMRGRWGDWRKKDGRMGKMEEKWRRSGKWRDGKMKRRKTEIRGKQQDGR